ncbi:MAG: phage terminase large subunit, partial [Clostridiales bacterium]|nr:phage terminase large subunit [Clostridiales bacterium]
HLCLPAEFEPNRKCITQIGWEDPRSSQGELLWPERFGPEEIEAKKKELGSYAYAGQFQQRPAPAGGGLFKREWFEIVDAAPSHIRKVRYWDFASTEEKIGTDPDYTVGCLMSEKDGIYYIEDIRRDRLSAMGVERLVKQTAMADTRLVPIWIEEEPGSSGKIVIDHYARKVLVGFAFRGNRATGSKIQRADPFAAAAEAGNVKLVQGNWNAEFLDEIETFPLGAHDDQVDAASGAFSKLFRTGELMTGVLSW